MAPYFYKLAQTYKDIQFVEVPVTDKNANLHQGLSVPSLPYGHIYHPHGGLVEELKINRKHFSKFAKIVHSYAQTTCDLIDGETKNPYPDPEEESAETSRSAEVSAWEMFRNTFLAIATTAMLHASRLLGSFISAHT